MQVLRLPMSFFDSQPAGRLLNRFSQDTESTDVAVRETIAWCLTCVGELIAPSFVWGSLPLLHRHMMPSPWHTSYSAFTWPVAGICLNVGAGVFACSRAHFVRVLPSLVNKHV